MKAHLVVLAVAMLSFLLAIVQPFMKFLARILPVMLVAMGLFLVTVVQFLQSCGQG